MAKQNEESPADLADLRNRQAKLRVEAETLIKQRDHLYRLRSDGTSTEELDEAARDLLAGRTMVALGDPSHELARIEQEIVINGRAQAIIAKSIGLAELQSGHTAALPLFAKAISHVSKLSKLFDALEHEQREAFTDLREFEKVANPLVGLEAQHPSQKPPYSEWQLAPLRTWYAELVADGSNKSKLAFWREEIRDLGLQPN